MKLLAEQPILISVLLGLLGVAFLYAWTRSGQRAMAIVGGVLLALIPVAWLVAESIETDEERIRALLTQLAADVEANQFERAYQTIHPDRTDVLQRARSELPRYEFSRARIGSFRTVRMLDGTSPPEAAVDLTAGVTVSLKNGAIRDQRVVRRLLLHLQKTPSGWKVIDYDHRQAVGSRDVYSTGSRDLEELLRP